MRRLFAKKRTCCRSVCAWAVLIVLAFTSAPALGQGKGKFGDKPFKLPWKIAFVRDRDVWHMNGDGSGEKQLTHFGNVVGRLSWGKDGKWVVYSRQGEVQYKLPGGGSGFHKCYDLYASHIDSTRSEFYWIHTADLSSLFPFWGYDDKYIVYTHDPNGRLIDSELPDYQVAIRNWDGTFFKVLTREGAPPRESMGLHPTISPDNKWVAFVYFKDKSALGLVVEPIAGIQRSEIELERAARTMSNAYGSAYGPAWAPDNSGIAYVSTDKARPGIYLADVQAQSAKPLFVPPSSLTLHEGPVSWSPDAQWLVFSSADGYIYVVDRNGKNLTKLSWGGKEYFPVFQKQ